MQFTLTAAACSVLNQADPVVKARRSRAAAADWRAKRLQGIGDSLPPSRPARPDHPLLVAPKDVPKRRLNSNPEGRIALLHALAHIELNAIDLAWDIIARFAGQALPEAFFDDWVMVADDEAKHYLMLADRLSDLGAAYGDLPAHDGLWQAAEVTAHDLLARLAVVPMVLEARGVDITPKTIDRLKSFGDKESAAALEVIYKDEITHVAAGRRWFEWSCQEQKIDPVQTFQELVRKYFKGQIKPPFNEEGRLEAGFPPHYYLPLSQDIWPQPDS
ncbi:ferritin-like domain-containing protein [Rhodovibrionaceae bacterium A322]